MICFECRNFSLNFICKNCQILLKNPNLSKRVYGNLKIFSFYSYSEIENLIKQKHKIPGRLIFQNLANLSFLEFAKTFKFGQQIDAIAIDDNPKNGYSHTAILAKALKNDEISPKFRTLWAKNQVSYSSKTLEFRQKNPRNFELLKVPKNPVILVDDIVTTGLTLNEAKICLEKQGVNVIFALTLADARL